MAERFTKLKHILESQQFDRSFLEKELFPEAKKMEKVAKRRGSRILKGKTVCNLFYEPSTRTRVSFETAEILLGAMPITTENAAEFSSAIKGESLEDTIRIINGYHHDAIIIRHPNEGACKQAAEVSKIPIINAGEGKGQHPTQALLDIYTIYEQLGSIDGLNVALVGDLAHSRTINSLAYLLAKFKNISIYFVSPKKFPAQEGIREHLVEHGIKFTESTDIRKVLPKVDIVYLTRPQKERLKDGEKFPFSVTKYGINKENLKLLNKKALVLDPLPRVGELPEEVDGDSRVAVFRQAQNGLYVRMALLKILLS